MAIPASHRRLSPLRRNRAARHNSPFDAMPVQAPAPLVSSDAIHQRTVVEPFFIRRPLG
jgi:hypothetical protein